MSTATLPCARAPGVAMRAPGSQCIFTVLAILVSGGRGPLAGHIWRQQIKILRNSGTPVPFWSKNGWADCSTVRLAIFTVNRQFWCPHSVKNRSAGARARRTGARWCRGTGPCARAPGGATRAPGSHCIFTGLDVFPQPARKWLAGSHTFRACRQP